MLRLIRGSSLLMAIVALGCAGDAGSNREPIVYAPGPTCTAWCEKAVGECQAYAVEQAVCVQSCEEVLAAGRQTSAPCGEAVEATFSCAAELDCQYIYDRVNQVNLDSYPCLAALENSDLTCTR